MDDTGETREELLAEIRALREERGILRALVNNLPDCNLFLKDRHCRFIITNNYHLRALGAESLADVVGKSDSDFFPRELAEQYRRDEERILHTGEPLINREERMVDARGREYWMLTTKVPLRSADGDIGLVLDGGPVEPTDIVGIVGLSRDITGHKELEEEQERTIHELDEALHRIKTLSGLLPICASCKKIRDDEGYWHQVETYIHERSDASFSHGICPECADTLYKEIREGKGGPPAD